MKSTHTEAEIVRKHGIVTLDPATVMRYYGRSMNALYDMRKLIYLVAQKLRNWGVDFHEKADLRVQKMQKSIESIGGINFTIELFDDGSWVAESTNIDGILTGGTSRDGFHETLKDAVFTYFEIPPQLCNDTLIKSPGEPIKLEQRIYA